MSTTTEIAGIAKTVAALRSRIFDLTEACDTKDARIAALESALRTMCEMTTELCTSSTPLSWLNAMRSKLYAVAIQARNVLNAHSEPQTGEDVSQVHG